MGNKKNKKSKKSPSQPSTSNQEPEYFEVDKILDLKVDNKGKRTFLISWIGYDESENSWEPEENLGLAKDAINRFLNEREKSKLSVEDDQQSPYGAVVHHSTLETPKDPNYIHVLDIKTEPTPSTIDQNDHIRASTASKPSTDPFKPSSSKSHSKSHEIPAHLTISGSLTREELQKRIDFVGLPYTVHQIEKMSRKAFEDYRKAPTCTPQQEYVLKTIKKRYVKRVSQNRVRGVVWKQNNKKRPTKQTLKPQDFLNSVKIEMDEGHTGVVGDEIEPSTSEGQDGASTSKDGITLQELTSDLRYATHEELQHILDLAKIPIRLEEIETVPFERLRIYFKKFTHEEVVLIRRIRRMYRKRIAAMRYRSKKRIVEDLQRRINQVKLPFTVEEIENMPRNEFIDLKCHSNLTNEQKFVLSTIRHHNSKLKSQKRKVSKVVKDDEKPPGYKKLNHAEMQHQLFSSGLPFTIEHIREMSNDDFAYCQKKFCLTKEQKEIFTTIRASRSSVRHASNSGSKDKDSAKFMNEAKPGTLDPKSIVPRKMNNLNYYERMQCHLAQIGLPLTVKEIEDLSNNAAVDYLITYCKSTEQISLFNRIRARAHFSKNKRKILENRESSSLKNPDELCQVCSDKASNQAYGVFSCESCNVFFLHLLDGTINMDELEPCDKECTITKEAGSLCKYCRMKKCFAIGMSEQKPNIASSSTTDANSSSAIPENNNSGSRKRKTKFVPISKRLSSNVPKSCSATNHESSTSSPIPKSKKFFKFVKTTYGDFGLKQVKDVLRNYKQVRPENFQTLTPDAIEDVEQPSMSTSSTIPASDDMQSPGKRIKVEPKSPEDHSPIPFDVVVQYKTPVQSESTTKLVEIESYPSTTMSILTTEEHTRYANVPTKPSFSNQDPSNGDMFANLPTFATDHDYLRLPLTYYLARWDQFEQKRYLYPKTIRHNPTSSSLQSTLPTLIKPVHRQRTIWLSTKQRVCQCTVCRRKKAFSSCSSTSMAHARFDAPIRLREDPHAPYTKMYIPVRCPDITRESVRRRWYIMKNQPSQTLNVRVFDQ